MESSRARKPEEQSSTLVTGSVVITRNRKCRQQLEGLESCPMDSIGSIGNKSIPMESPEV